MSSSIAPKFPKTSVFIPAYWENARAGLLTQDEADLLYLKFPIGQGTESIPNLIVSGTTTLGITSATAPATADNSTRVPTTDWVNTAIINAGSKYTYTATNTLSSATSTAFPNCFSSSPVYNSYDIYIVFNSTPVSFSFPTITMTFTGITPTSYSSFKTTTSSSATPTITNTWSNSNGYAWLADAVSQSVGSLSQQTFKLSVWGMKNQNSGGAMMFQYTGENWASNNPGGSYMLKTFGYVNSSAGTPTGLTLTFTSATISGNVSIYVSSNYS